MAKIISSEQIDLIPKDKKIVLVGGCFDILHLGHITFLEKARESGEIVVMLESDQNIKRLKGGDRPVNPQESRAKVLSHIDLVSYIILLPEMETDDEYDQLVAKIGPKVIATTRGDAAIHHKVRQSKLTGAVLLEVVDPLPAHSTSLVLETISKKI
jgi:FAD synthetase